jgi:hypothetical protein
VTQEQVKMFAWLGDGLLRRLGLSRHDVKVAALAVAMVLAIQLILPGKSLLMSCHMPKWDSITGRLKKYKGQHCSAEMRRSNSKRSALS